MKNENWVMEIWNERSIMKNENWEKKNGKYEMWIEKWKNKHIDYT